jgi:hypothetical protein
MRMSFFMDCRDDEEFDYGDDGFDGVEGEGRIAVLRA